MSFIKEKEKKVAPSSAEPIRASRKGAFIFLVREAGRLLRGEFLAHSVLRKELPYLLLLAVLGTLYIGNAYRAEKKMMEIRKLQEKTKDMYTRYIALKSELMFTLTRSEIETALAEEGIRQMTSPPAVIRYTPENLATPIY
jgi:hypothetical protein